MTAFQGSLLPNGTRAATRRVTLDWLADGVVIAGRLGTQANDGHRSSRKVHEGHDDRRRKPACRAAPRTCHGSRPETRWRDRKRRRGRGRRHRGGCRRHRDGALVAAGRRNG